MKMKLIDISNKISKGSTPRGKVNYSKKENNYFLRVTDMIDLADVYNSEFTLSDEDINNNKMKMWPINTILVSIEGTVGKISILKKEMFFNQAVAGIIPNEEIINPRYLMYYLRTTPVFSSILKGTIMPALRLGDLSEIEIEVPSMNIQNKLVSIVDSITNKINLNNEINNNLSEQLKTIFYEWFESKMDDDLPDDWKIVDLQDVATFSQGVQVPIEEQIEQKKDGFVRFIRIVDITQGSDKEIRFIEDRDRGHVVENEIFMTRYGTPGILSRNYNGIIANNLFKITPSDGVTSNYLFSALNVDRIQKYIKGNATSSTMPAISFSTLNNQKVIIPDRETLGKFDEYSETVRKKQLNIINENKRLEQLRDTLLPKLMNGEIDLDNIEI